jgi:hypothetical protein
MDKLDKYLKTHEYIIYNKLIKNYEKFNYKDEDDLILDLNLLLSVKYKNIKVYKTKKHYLKGKEYNYKKDEPSYISEYNDINEYYDFFK